MEPSPAHAPDAVAVGDHLRRHGWADLGPVLDRREVAAWTGRFDRDRRDHPASWRMHANADTWLSADVLATAPAFDALVRHPRILAAIAAAFAAEPLFWETSLRSIAALGGRTRPDGWHEDFPPRGDRRVLQAMVALTDVDGGSSCLAVTPRDAGEPRLAWADEDRRHPHRECLGPAGSVWLFDPTMWHTPRYRGDRERKTVHTYYCAGDDAVSPACSPHSVVPRALWAGDDRASASFYRLAPLGQRTALMRAAFAA